MTLEPGRCRWCDVASRLTAAMVAQRGYTTPAAAAAALFPEVRDLLLSEAPTPE